jgi:carboxypeptidase PM20D1
MQNRQWVGSFMRRVLIGVAVVIVAILAVVVARTLSLPQPGADVAAVVPIPVDSKSVAQHLGAAVRFRTVSYGNGVREAEKDAALEALRGWMAKTYPNFHKVAKREIIGESLLYTWKGTNSALAPILLMAHMDVVPIVPGTEKSWAHGPFSGDVAGGYVWGRGSIDDKGSLVMILEAAERLAKSGFTPERTVMFAFGEDEEDGGAKGNGVIAETLKARGVHFDFVLDEGGAILDEPFPGVQRPVAFVAVAEKGYRSRHRAIGRGHIEGGEPSLCLGSRRHPARKARDLCALCAVSAAPAARQFVAVRTDRRQIGGN